MQKVYLQIKLRNDPKTVAVPFDSGDVEKDLHIARQTLNEITSIIEDLTKLNKWYGLSTLDEFGEESFEAIDLREVTRISIRMLNVREPQPKYDMPDEQLARYLSDQGLT